MRKVESYYGKSLDSMSREELIEVINELSNKLDENRQEFRNDLRELRVLGMRVW